MTSLHATGVDRERTHLRTQELLPWYVNRTLQDAEMQEVETHLAACTACRNDVARCKALAASLGAREPAAVWSPPQGHLERTLARIRDAGTRAPRAEATEARWPWRGWQRCGEWIRGTPTPVRWVLAGQFAALAVLSVALVGPQLAPAPRYQTLSRPEGGAASAAFEIRVVFDASITEQEVRTLLRSEDAGLAGGPSSVGAYTIAVQEERARARLLERLRSHPKVRLAEPLDAAGAP